MVCTNGGGGKVPLAFVGKALQHSLAQI
jgi:hypothetical protein